ncbi:hypothetical protein DPMN_068903 [Dreissena polymorpha]|uniref:SAM domain-containing protein n=1 Tax=Dreissena polymorpha TaxID=45954 RepID=A0A9D3YY30_DREPO|nr:hypothetical protein DPMN_068903 [Dreissena polymorpha]
MKPDSPEHNVSTNKAAPPKYFAICFTSVSHFNIFSISAKMEKKPAHARKLPNPLALRSPLTLAVDFSDEKIPVLPARRRLSQPAIMPLAAEAYVNTSFGQVTVRPITWKSADLTENDANVNAYESVSTEQCVLSVAHGDSKSVANGKTNGSRILSNDTDGTYKDQNIKSANIEKMKDLTINEIGDILRLLKLEEYVEIFKENHVDGVILTSLERDDLVNELGMNKLPATRLFMYMTASHISK